MDETLLWLLVVNLGIAFGAGLYEHRIGASRWLTVSASEVHWNAETAQGDDSGRRFWAFVTTMPLTLLTVASLYAAWHSAGPARSWWLAAGVFALADRAFTFAYFIPVMVRLMRAADSPASVALATQWLRLNYLRHAIVFVAWLTALRALERF
jgi:hypothetical protein